MTDQLAVLTGPRRIGKSVALLDTAAALCARRDMDARQVIYLPCDGMAAQDVHRCLVLGRELTRSIDRDSPRPRVWLLDEISDVTGWTSILKLARDNTAFGGDTVIATGSRWAADEDVLDSVAFDLDGYDLAWQDYLTCGGFPRAVAEHTRIGAVSTAYLNDLRSWLRADVDPDRPQDSVPRLLDGISQRATSPLNITATGTARVPLAGHLRQAPEPAGFQPYGDLVSAARTRPSGRGRPGQAVPDRPATGHSPFTADHDAS